MKMVLAIIKPFKLDDVRAELAKIGVDGMTVTDARGFGEDAGETEIYRGVKHYVSFMPKVRIESVVPDKLLDKTIKAIMDAAATGRPGDGKIFVYDVTEAHCISTGNKNDKAL